MDRRNLDNSFRLFVIPHHAYTHIYRACRFVSHFGIAYPTSLILLMNNMLIRYVRIFIEGYMYLYVKSN
jgi:hypothetical protein